MKEIFISPLDDDIVKGLDGDRNNLANTAALLKAALDIPPEEYDRLTLVDPSLRRRWKQRGDKGRLGILDFRLLTASGKTIDLEIQIRYYKLMAARLVFYTAMMTADQMKAGQNYDRLRQIVTMVITDHVMLPDEEDYLNTYELRNRKTGRLFTDLQQYVIVELPKLPDGDDGRPLWPQLRFLKCRTKEEMAMVTEKHPEVRPLAAEYQRMTLVEKLRKRAEYREKDRRDEWAALEYARDEGRAESQQALAEKDRAILETRREIEEFRRKLREAGIDPR
jgi:predicted transposase/invertase (TIGR01784 family)